MMVAYSLIILRSLARPVAHVEIGFDGHEDEFAAILSGEGDVGGFLCHL
jgi:hypothetical protein